MKSILACIIKHSIFIYILLLPNMVLGENIDGPANVRDKPQGDVIISLDDGVTVDCIDIQNKWYKLSFVVRMEKKSFLKKLRIKKDTILHNNKGKNIGKTIQDIKVPHGYFETREYCYIPITAYTYIDNIKREPAIKDEVSQSEEPIKKPTRARRSTFDNFKEITVFQSPNTGQFINFNKEIIDFCVLPSNSNVAVIIKDRKYGIYLWNYNAIEKLNINYPLGFVPKEIIAHPQEKRIFLLGKYSDNSTKSESYKILSYDIVENILIELYSDPVPLRNLITSSAKFGNYYTGNNFRLYFARKNKNNTEILTIAENGKFLYPVLSNTTEFSADRSKHSDGSPNTLNVSFGIPITFHPTGNILFWRKENGAISALQYYRDNWKKIFKPNFAEYIDNWGNIEFSPNSMYLLIWKNKSRKVVILDMFLNKLKKLSLNSKIESRIKFTPDGRGIIYLKDKNELIYKPLNLPLYDVENAWMFCADGSDIKKFSKDGGLFRKTTSKQMYGLYESENYHCGRYSPRRPTRPYFVTTDPFHEILEAAYSGLFYVNERDFAKKYFNQFVTESKEIFDSKIGDGYTFWQKLFQNTSKILNGVYDNDELIMVKNAAGIANSIVLQKNRVNYAEFKPRGYYEQNEEMSNYFRAVQYISMAKPDKSQWNLFLNHEKVNGLIKNWVNSYKAFIPPSRRLLPGEEKKTLPYVKHELKSEEELLTLFPKAWGIDNEILDSVVYHQNWPKQDQVIGINREWRLIPDINELAYVFGSDLSRKLLEKRGVYKQYPVLERIHKDLINRWQNFQKEGGTGIYNKWLILISKQISGNKPEWPWLTEELWETKQIQTGLSSWTNLRHATVLVNERGAAECGEGGFEFITRKPPRGAVEPHPEAFQGLIIVFEELKKIFLANYERSDIRMYIGKYKNFKEGIIKRLDNVIKNLQRFKEIAEKEVNDEPLTDEEYELILTCGKSIEHDFLVFKSIMTEGYGLAKPDPMSKTVDVYGGGVLNTDILHCAVGLPLEWDLIVPYYGRKQVVKGAVYSFYSFTKPNPISDKDWRSELNEHDLPEWIMSYISKNKLSCPAKTSFTSQ